MESRGLARKRVTIADLAKLLGMDKSSVSLALRDSPRVARATREKVQRLAREHNYTPNWAAKQLAGSLGHAIGMVMPSAFACLHHPNVARTVQALAQLAAARGLTVNLIASEELADSKDEGLVPLHADGLLVWGDVPAASTAWFSTAYARPAIVLDPHHPSYANYAGNTIHIRNKEGASAITAHLYDRGARRLCFVHVVTEHLSHDHRWTGTLEAWQERAEASALSRVYLDALSDAELKKLADCGNAAIFCSNDMGAMQVWHRLLALGVSVPSDIKLAGFDGDDYGALIGLTTALFDSTAMADRAFSSMLELLSKDKKSIGGESIPITVRIGTTT
jgi:DNA-binding LacI/PurR family transcriptional regulator